MENKKYTWDELFEKAMETGFGEPALKAKDEARGQVVDIVRQHLGIDIETSECVEDEIDFYCEEYEIFFDERGNILSSYFYNEYYARNFISAIKILASKPDNLDNFESYLSHHFSSWLEKYTKNPDIFIAEINYFAEMEV